MRPASTPARGITMRILTLVWVAAIACGHAAPRVAPMIWPQPGGTATTGELYGRIVDWHRAPLAGVPLIVVSGASSATAVTDADGRYHLTGLAPGVYVLTYQVGEALRERRNIAIEAGQAIYAALTFDDRSFFLE